MQNSYIDTGCAGAGGAGGRCGQQAPAAAGAAGAGRWSVSVALEACSSAVCAFREWYARRAASGRRCWRCRCGQVDGGSRKSSSASNHVLAGNLMEGMTSSASSRRCRLCRWWWAGCQIPANQHLPLGGRTPKYILPSNCPPAAGHHRAAGPGAHLRQAAPAAGRLHHRPERRGGRMPAHPQHAHPRQLHAVSLGPKLHKLLHMFLGFGCFNGSTREGCRRTLNTPIRASYAQ